LPLVFIYLQAILAIKRVERLPAATYNGCIRHKKRDTGGDTMPRPRRLDIELTVKTKEAARLLDRRPQTLRKWACYGGGPIEPIRSQGRLLWALEDIERLRKFRNTERQKAQQKAQQRQKAKQQRSGAS
jgi:hypothetical protein